MLVVDRLLVSGLTFVLRRIAAAAEESMNDDSALREELLAAQMRLELGEISEDEFAQIETAVLRGLRDIQERKRGGAHGRARAGGKIAVESVEAALDHREDDGAGNERASR
jgi:hypothetical protein